MKLVVISPEGDDAREHDVLAALFAAGLERYHVRKPGWSRTKLEAWLDALPAEACRRIVLHQDHELAAKFSLGGLHGRSGTAGGSPAPVTAAGQRPALPTSRSCHTLGELRAALGRCDSVFVSPVFPSISKPGYGPAKGFPLAEISALLVQRDAAQRRTTVLALGGITPETAPRALVLGFDGVAALGAVWQAADPLRAFVELQNSITCHAA